MTRKLISLRLDEALLKRLDEHAHSIGSTRTGVLEAMAVALLEGRLAVVPQSASEHTILPTRHQAGCSPLHPAQICLRPTDAEDG